MAAILTIWGRLGGDFGDLKAILSRFWQLWGRFEGVLSDFRAIYGRFRVLWGDLGAFVAI